MRKWSRERQTKCGGELLSAANEISVVWCSDIVRASLGERCDELIDSKVAFGEPWGVAAVCVIIGGKQSSAEPQLSVWVGLEIDSDRTIDGEHQRYWSDK